MFFDFSWFFLGECFLQWNSLAHCSVPELTKFGFQLIFIANKTRMFAFILSMLLRYRCCCCCCFCFVFCFCFCFHLFCYYWVRVFFPLLGVTIKNTYCLTHMSFKCDTPDSRNTKHPIKIKLPKYQWKYSRRKL